MDSSHPLDAMIPSLAVVAIALLLWIGFEVLARLERGTKNTQRVIRALLLLARMTYFALILLTVIPHNDPIAEWYLLRDYFGMSFHGSITLGVDGWLVALSYFAWPFLLATIVFNPVRKRLSTTRSTSLVLVTLSLVSLCAAACGRRSQGAIGNSDNASTRGPGVDSGLSSLAQFVRATHLVPKNYPELSVCKFVTDGGAGLRTSDDCPIEYSRSGKDFTTNDAIIEKTEVKTDALKQSSGLNFVRQAFRKSETSSAMGRSVDVDISGEYETHDGFKITFSGKAHAFRSPNTFSNQWNVTFYFKDFTAVMDMSAVQVAGEQPEAHFTINGAEIPGESWEKYIPSSLHPLKGLKNI